MLVIWRVASTPVMPGMFRSITTTSGASSRTERIASARRRPRRRSGLLLEEVPQARPEQVVVVDDQDAECVLPSLARLQRRLRHLPLPRRAWERVYCPCSVTVTVRRFTRGPRRSSGTRSISAPRTAPPVSAAIASPYPGSSSACRAGSPTGRRPRCPSPSGGPSRCGRGSSSPCAGPSSPAAAGVRRSRRRALRRGRRQLDRDRRRALACACRLANAIEPARREAALPGERREVRASLGSRSLEAGRRGRGRILRPPELLRHGHTCFADVSCVRACLSSRSIAWSLEARFLSPSSPLTASSSDSAPRSTDTGSTRPALVELADPATQPLLGHVDGLPGDVELDPEARQLACVASASRRCREGGERTSCASIGRAPAWRPACVRGSVARAELGDPVRRRGRAARRRKRNRRKPQQYRESARASLLEHRARGGTVPNDPTL